MYEHTFYKCDGSCDGQHCKFCDGGLSFCTACKGAEGDMPTDCPGEPITESQSSLIYSAKIDYVRGQWVKK